MDQCFVIYIYFHTTIWRLIVRSSWLLQSLVSYMYSRYQLVWMFGIARANEGDEQNQRTRYLTTNLYKATSKRAETTIIYSKYLLCTSAVHYCQHEHKNGNGSVHLRVYSIFNLKIYAARCNSLFAVGLSLVPPQYGLDQIFYFHS